MASPSSLSAEEMFARHPGTQPTEQYLEQLVALYAMRSEQLCTAQWLLDNGLHWEHAPRPRWVRQKPPKQCYWNAIHLARRGRGRYVYCEGMATNLIPVDHAWCYDRETGLIVDPTWEMGYDYIGVPIQTGYAWSVIREARAVVMDWTHGCPIITGTVPTSAWREPLTPGGANA